MAVARMRHHNSPEELAKRATEGEQAPLTGKEFRHYNHPAEVAKRAAAGEQPGAAIVPRRPAPRAAAMVWPPPGTVDNTESVTASEAPAKRPTEPPPRRGDVDTRLRRIENLLWTFLDSTDEAREFRRLLNNLAAVTDVQLDINNRLRTVEDQIEAALAEAEAEAAQVMEGDDDGDDDGAPELASDADPLEPLTDDDSPPPGEEEPAEPAPEEPPTEALEPPPTVPDNPPKGEAT